MSSESTESAWPRRLARLALVAAIAALGWFAYERIQSVEIPVLAGGDARLPVGVYHVTSAASRDTAHPEQSWAKHAAAQGLDFVVVTDIDDQLAGPVTYEDVTVLCAAELDTAFGRVVQLGAETVLEEKTRDRLELHSSIRGIGGTPVLSHPSDPKRPWTGPIEGAGGLEIASFASQMRQTAGPVFLGALPSLVAYELRPSLALVQLYQRDERALERWDAESDPGFVGFCGADNRGLLKPEDNLLTWQLILDEPLDDESDASDADQLVERLAAGRFYCAAGLFGTRPYFRFGALKGDEWAARPGDQGVTASEIVIFGPTAKPDPVTLILFRNGSEVARFSGEELRYRDPRPGTYRAEVRVSLPHVFWGERLVTAIYSNRIRLLPSEDPKTIR
ncbi:MAG: hypothetical protein AAFY60_03705 [Myxococcota bacterium]